MQGLYDHAEALEEGRPFFDHSRKDLIGLGRGGGGVAEAFDLTLGATYYEVEIVDEIIELFSQTSIDDCYNDAENDSTFCENSSRADLGGGLSGLITEVDEAFLNRDSLKTRGVDINLAVDWPTDFTIAGRPLDIGADFNFNRKLEFSDVFISTSSGQVSKDSDLGQFGLPEWEGQGIARFDVGNFRFTWSTRYIGSVERIGKLDESGIEVCDDEAWRAAHQRLLGLRQDAGYLSQIIRLSASDDDRALALSDRHVELAAGHPDHLGEALRAGAVGERVHLA